MRYIPHTQNDIEEMLKAIGVKSVDELFDTIPEPYRLKRPLDLEPTLHESALMKHVNGLASKNQARGLVSFMGAGMYAHHIPPAVDQLLLRSEFYTAYTPYQAEVSQGTLQAMYEFQTITAELLGMEVANASMYDGASAAAEAALMARRITGRNKILVSAGVHPEYLETIQVYCRGLDGEQADVATVPLDAAGQTDVRALKTLLTDDVAALIVGYPNFFGCVEDVAQLSEALAQRYKENAPLLISATAEPYALGLIKSPGECGVSIAVGEGQALAVPPQYGGPGVGLFACKRQYVQRMPGRLVGETVDGRGVRGFVLTLSTREQHIRRERATSNICTNHGLIALAMTMRVAMLGQVGFAQVAQDCFNKSEYLKAAIGKLKSCALTYVAPTFNEFCVRFQQNTAQEVLESLLAHKMLGGVPLSRFYKDRPNEMLISVNENHTNEELDALMEALSGV